MAYCNPHNYSLAQCYYNSPYIHTVRLPPLKPSTQYTYRPSTSSRWRLFKTPPAMGSPISFGVLADLGQTQDSLNTMLHMKAKVNSGLINSVLFPGDLCYADGYAPAWDTCGRLGEFLWESVPTAFGIGNHEVTSGLENFAHFTPRHAWPYSEQSKSTSPYWYSFESGMVHVVMLCSYCDYSPASSQYAWLLADLQSVERSRTPWVIALWHTPWYVTSIEHGQSESHAMRTSLESLLYTHKVDIVLSGHLHAYERTDPVYLNNPVCDGPIYITAGDAGNHEGPACPWNQTQPSWSKFREFSFGFGILSFTDSTHASWAWHRNQDDEAVMADQLNIVPASLRCQVKGKDIFV